MLNNEPLQGTLLSRHKDKTIISFCKIIFKENLLADFQSVVIYFTIQCNLYCNLLYICAVKQINL